MNEEEIRTLVREVIARRNVAAAAAYQSAPAGLLRQHAAQDAGDFVHGLDLVHGITLSLGTPASERPERVLGASGST